MAAVNCINEDQVFFFCHHLALLEQVHLIVRFSNFIEWDGMGMWIGEPDKSPGSLVRASETQRRWGGMTGHECNLTF